MDDWSIQAQAKPDAFNIQTLNWEQAREAIREAAPKLFEVIESLDPGKNLEIIRARYPYGSLIIDKGKLQIPHKTGHSIPIDSVDIDPKFRQKLSYASVPLTLPLNKSCEVFIEGDERSTPLKVISPGWFFGLFEVTAWLAGLAIHSIWSVSSGARSIFMLPKISDKLGYNRIKKELNLSLNVPRSLFDHWQLFTVLSKHPSKINDWYTDVLFFTEDWFSYKTSDPKWAIFYNYLFIENNIQSHYNRDDIALNMTWKYFVRAIGERSLRPKPYMLDTLKHLIAIAAGTMPAFCPADFSETMAPTKMLQNIYVELYDLKHYLPTLMHIHILMMGQKVRPVYYSLAYPVLQEYFGRKYPDVIANQREIQLLFRTLEMAIQSGRISMPSSQNNLIKNRKYDFFHNSADFFEEIPPAEKMLIADPDLEQDKKRFPNRVFCTTSPFLSGCIRISIRE